MAKTVVVEKDGIKKTVPEEYKSDYIVAGWKEATATPTATSTLTATATAPTQSPSCTAPWPSDFSRSLTDP